MSDKSTLEIPIDELRKLLAYDNETGRISWLVSHGPAKIGQEAGSLHKKSPGRFYRRISIGRRSFQAHRIAWALHYGEWPKHQIDHINGDTLDNRVSNLRDVPPSVNMKNLPLLGNNSSGVHGVYYDKALRKWVARIWANGKKISLGCFIDYSDAFAARKAAEAKYGFHENHGRAYERH